MIRPAPRPRVASMGPPHLISGLMTPTASATVGGSKHVVLDFYKEKRPCAE